MNEVRAIFGTGGLARETMQVLWRDTENMANVFFMEDKPRALRVDGISVLATDEFLSVASPKFFCVAVGDPHAREQIARRLFLKGAMPFSIISSRASIVGDGTIGDGTIVLDGARISHNHRIGAHCIVNFNAVIGHDAAIGSYVTVSPGAGIMGWVTVHPYAYIGAGALIINGSENERMEIGTAAIIGMGAKVLRNVPTGRRVVETWKGERASKTDESGFPIHYE